MPEERTQSLPLITPAEPPRAGGRVVLITGVAIVVALAAGLIARALTLLIAFITNLAFYGRLSAHDASPAGNSLGLLVIAVPVVGGLIVGAMARYGSKAIRGHGIPEAMEQVLFNESRIPARLTLLKPISAAIAIGTGGPFGAEGPIIATGGAIGSVVGQLLPITADERKTLLAAGAAAGMSATFGSPIAAVLLAIELLLFEYRPASMVAVALASVTAAAVRAAFVGTGPALAATILAAPGAAALFAYVLLGAIVGLASAGVTRAVYAIEDQFARLPIHWMWWPAIGGLVVGLIGLAAPRTLGIGYENLSDMLSGRLLGEAALVFCCLKFLSWAIALGSGTSGGTLAPLLSIGGGFGAAVGAAAAAWMPGLGIDPRAAALVGMAAMFAGAARALLAAVIFAYETTRQPMEMLPLLGGCAAAFLVSRLVMRHSIMTEKIARRGARVGVEYVLDFLDQVHVREVMSTPAILLRANQSLTEARHFLQEDPAASTHQGFPVVDADGVLMGVLTRREIEASDLPAWTPTGQLIRRPAAVIYEDSSLREAADQMAHEDVGRLPVITRGERPRPVGMLTRSDLVMAHRRRLRGTRVVGGGGNGGVDGARTRDLRLDRPAF